MQLIVVCLVVAHDLMGWGHGFSWHRLCGDIAHHCCCRHRYGARKSPEVALLFLRLGATSFGGPTAYIGLMHHEVVVRRKWIDDQRFLDLMSATMSLPGPNATEIASHLGLIRAGWRGLIAAGGLFILPGMAAILAVAWAYVRYGSLPEVAWVLYGVKPAVIAIIVQAVWSLGRKGLKGPPHRCGRPISLIALPDRLR